MTLIEQCMKERDAALLSLDRSMIEVYYRKWGVPIPVADRTFWGSVHKARVVIIYFPEAEKEISRQWLRENGFKLEILGKKI